MTREIHLRPLAIMMQGRWCESNQSVVETKKSGEELVVLRRSMNGCIITVVKNDGERDALYKSPDFLGLYAVPRNTISGYV